MVRFYLQYRNVIKTKNVALLLVLLYTVLVKAQTQEGTNNWIGHVYYKDGVFGNQKFSTYRGYITESSVEFTEEFGNFNNDWGGFDVDKPGGGTYNVRRRYFSVRFLMNYTLGKGLYRATIGTDDGARLIVDGEKVFDSWKPQPTMFYAEQLFKLTDNSTLKLEYYENTGGNRIVFRDFIRMIENVISGEQIVCEGQTPSEITGDAFENLPNDYVSAYQWVYSSSPGGAKTDIVGATSQNFTPNINSEPFKNPGTYYISRKATLTHKNYRLDENPVNHLHTEEIVSNEVTLTVNKLPNNVEFKGKNICFGETAKLTYNAEDETFVSPHTIVYKNDDTGIQYTQEVNTASAFEFQPGDTITTAGYHWYEIVSITDGNGCVRTSGVGKDKARIWIKGEVECLITGDDTVCPKKTFTYSAPDNMKTYNWSVTGNATIQGANNTQNVNVLTGDLNSGNDFTLTVVVRSKGGCEKTCTKTVSVADSTKPTFTKPADVSLCVNNIINANYNDTTNGDVNTPPDYYEFPADYTDLDITNVSDDCCDTENTITWTITPTSNGTTISGTGQPSATLSGKKLWLDVATSNPKSSYTEKTYTIKYKVTDCNGNESDEQTTTITIKPRPKINTN